MKFNPCGNIFHSLHFFHLNCLDIMTHLYMCQLGLTFVQYFCEKSPEQRNYHTV